jgi:hypothetical protein
MGENSPNLVTLFQWNNVLLNSDATQFSFFFSKRKVSSSTITFVVPHPRRVTRFGEFSLIG